MSGWLQDQVAYVTGGASGIGLAVVRRYLEEGARGVVVVDRDIGPMAPLLSEAPGRLRAIQGDVRTFDVHQQAVEAAHTSFGQLDILVGNAGVYDFRRPLHGYDPATLASTMEELFAVNLRGYLYAALASQALLRESGGCMIFTGSVASQHAGGGGILYTMAKHAVLGLVRQLALEMAPQVRVNAVGPGGTLTALGGTQALGHAARSLRDGSDQLAERLAAALPLRFAQQPEDHAGLYVLLGSRRNARAITGEIFMSDGGIAIRPL